MQQMVTKVYMFLPFCIYTQNNKHAWSTLAGIIMPTYLSTLLKTASISTTTLLFLWAGVQPTLDPYAEAFFIAGPLC